MANVNVEKMRVFYILVYKVPRKIGYDLSISPLYSNHSPIPH